MKRLRKKKLEMIRTEANEKLFDYDRQISIINDIGHEEVSLNSINFIIDEDNKEYKQVQMKATPKFA